MTQTTGYGRANGLFRLWPPRRAARRREAREAEAQRRADARARQEQAVTAASLQIGTSGDLVQWRVPLSGRSG